MAGVDVGTVKAILGALDCERDLDAKAEGSIQSSAVNLPGI